MRLGRGWGVGIFLGLGILSCRRGFSILGFSI